MLVDRGLILLSSERVHTAADSEADTQSHLWMELEDYYGSLRGRINTPGR